MKKSIAFYEQAILTYILKGKILRFDNSDFFSVYHLRVSFPLNEKPPTKPIRSGSKQNNVLCSIRQRSSCRTPLPAHMFAALTQALLRSERSSSLQHPGARCAESRSAGISWCVGASSNTDQR